MYNLHNNPKPLVPAIRHEVGINYKELEQHQLMSILFAQKIKLEMQDLSDQLKISKELYKSYEII